LNKETHNLKVLEITIDRLIKVYQITEIPEFKDDIEREIRKAAMTTGEQFLFDYANERNAELMSLDYRLSHIEAAKNILKELEKEVNKKRENLIEKLNSEY
jgi:hypothetical protein